MASRRIVQVVDDVDGTEGASEVRFALDGVEYEIDLTEANAARLREALEPWTTAGRRTGGRRLRRVS